MFVHSTLILYQHKRRIVIFGRDITIVYIKLKMMKHDIYNYYNVRKKSVLKMTKIKRKTMKMIGMDLVFRKDIKFIFISYFCIDDEEEETTTTQEVPVETNNDSEIEPVTKTEEPIAAAVVEEDTTEKKPDNEMDDEWDSWS